MQSTAADVEAALEAISTVGDVSVVKSPYDPNFSSFVEWFVTFTTMGYPTNAGELAASVNIFINLFFVACTLYYFILIVLNYNIKCFFL